MHCRACVREAGEQSRCNDSAALLPCNCRGAAQLCNAGCWRLDLPPFANGESLIRTPSPPSPHPVLQQLALPAAVERGCMNSAAAGIREGGFVRVTKRGARLPWALSQPSGAEVQDGKGMAWRPPVHWRRLCRALAGRDLHVAATPRSSVCIQRSLTKLHTRTPAGIQQASATIAAVP